MIPKLEIFSQGEEIVTGQTVDTNAAWLSQQAVSLGFMVTRHTAVGDKLDDLVVLLREIASRAECCLCTGGLGPTSDDLTSEAVAKAFDLPLVFDPIAFEQIQQFFNQRQQPMPAANRKQAMLPKGAERLDNALGTAPGFALWYQNCWLVFLPGVPSEMRQLFSEKVKPTLNQGFNLQAHTLVSIKTFGLGESLIQQRLEEITLPETVQLGFRASQHDVQTKLLFPPNFDSSARHALVTKLHNQLGEAVFAIDTTSEATGDLVTTLDQLMTSAGQTLAVVETISQGLLAGLCTGSAWLLESTYHQSLPRLLKKLGITESTENLSRLAQIIAFTTAEASGADYALVQLYDGSFQALQDKTQATLLHTVLFTKGPCYCLEHTVVGIAKHKQHRAALLAVDMLRRYLQFGRL